MIQFSAKIEVVGVNPCVKVPSRVSKHFGKRGYVPVIVQLERGRVPSTLVPIGGGAHRLYINGIMLRYTDSGPGKRVTICLEGDFVDRRLEMPRDMRDGVASTHLAQKRWAAFTPSKQKEVIRYLSAVKTDETRKRNLKKLLEILNSESGEGLLCGIKIASKIPKTLPR